MSALKKEWSAPYLATAYVVRSPEGEVVLRIGARHAGLDDMVRMAGHDHWAYVTAWNPGSRLLAPAQNGQRQERLLERLKQMGLPWLPGAGVPDGAGWAAEESILVMGLDEGAALALGREFGQNAVVCGRIGEEARLLWCGDS